MRAMVLHRPGEKLRQEIVPDPEPAPNELLIRIEACGVCRTDLHIVDGDLKNQSCLSFQAMKSWGG